MPQLLEKVERLQMHNAAYDDVSIAAGQQFRHVAQNMNEARAEVERLKAICSRIRRKCVDAIALQQPEEHANSLNEIDNIAREGVSRG